MDVSVLESLVKEGLSQREIASKLSTSHTNIRYWLKKFNITTNLTIELIKECYKCKRHLHLNEFYNRRNGKGNSPYCKKCTNVQVTERQRRLKQELVDYKGGQCESCGYSKCNAALEFHHTDPTKKDFSMGRVKLTKFNQKIKDELDKCIMLCANCHREVHHQLGLSSNG